jgi:2-dehydro-3-deoxygluconokinase
MSRIVALGEIMARFSSPGYRRLAQCMPGSLNVIFAGAEASVAMSIAHLGGQAAFVTALPQHEIADACLATLRGIGVDIRHVVRTSEGRLGLYFLEAGINQRPSRVIYDRDGSSIAITPAEAYDWDGIFADAHWLVISGITPALSKNAAELTQRAVQEATERGVRVLCDMNYRAKLWRWDPSLAPRQLALRALRDLLPSVDLFIAGTDEISELLGEPPASAGSGDADDPTQPFATIAGRLAERFPRLRWIASTRRRTSSASVHELGGVLFDVPSGKAFAAPLQDQRYEPYRIAQMVDRIGTGDAFTAGLLFALTTTELADPRAAIAFASSAFCLAHSIDGDFNFSSRGEIEALAAGDASGRVQR